MTQIILTVISWAITSILGAIASYAIYKLKAERKKKEEARAELKNREDARTQGMRSILRGEIIRSHDKYIERGYCPIYAKEALQSQYDAYHQLGGNGVITKLFRDVMELPEQPPTEAKQSAQTQKANRKNGGYQNDTKRNN